jgi:hypothetical protein
MSKVERMEAELSKAETSRKAIIKAMHESAAVKAGTQWWTDRLREVNGLTTIIRRLDHAIDLAS